MSDDPPKPDFPPPRWTRRDLLWTLGGAALWACRRSPPRLAPGARFEGFPISRVDSFLTPTPDFFVRDHFGVPAARADGWVVSVEGDVENPLEVRLDELAGLPHLDEPVTLECAGNA